MVKDAKYFIQVQRLKSLLSKLDVKAAEKISLDEALTIIMAALNDETYNVSVTDLNSGSVVYQAEVLEILSKL